MTKDYRRELQGLLRKLFQFDSADLDFGIYRIMNYKRDEIEKFIEKDLLQAVNVEFEKYSAKSREEIEGEIEETKKRIASTLGEDALLPSGDLKEMYRSSPIAKEFYKKNDDLKNNEMADQHKAEIFSHMYQFFSRYYDEGDFISLRRYSRQNKYAIPYNGEEVLMHWANKDQYYIKDVEYFRNYSFRIGEYKINFRILNIAETDQIVNRSGNRFFLFNESENRLIYDDTSHELTIIFEYRTLTEDETRRYGTRDVQEVILRESREKLVSQIKVEGLRSALTRTEGAESILDKNFRRYTKGNTTDYFIHKDLKGFLLRELDFYLKNEVLLIDTLCSEGEVSVEDYIGRIKVLKLISSKIIDFLAQIEEFQKKLWLKKKFVIETRWCVALNTILGINDEVIRESLIAEIISNNDQCDEWVALNSINNIQSRIDAPGYSEPLKKEFLTAYPTLMVDTCHFSQDFVSKLLNALGDLDENTDGILIQSDNFQALSLLQARYGARINCVYADPPFNTAATEIAYKNDYKHSSWLALINDRVHLATPLMMEESSMCLAIDDTELTRLVNCLSSELGEERRLATVAVRSNPHGRAMAAGFSVNHEYALFWGKNPGVPIGRLPRDDAKMARYPHVDSKGAFTWINFRKTGAASRRVDRPKLFYPVHITSDGRVRIPELKWFDTSGWVTIESPKANEDVVLPIDDDDTERVWGLGVERAKKEAPSELEARKANGNWQVYRKYRPHEDGALPGTWWDNAKYSATESGTKIITDLFGERELFSYPKSIYLVEDCLRVLGCRPDSLTLDYFAGSGTTGHAIINLNREDGGKRKFILIEIANYFDTVLLPRLKKVCFSPEWKKGMPVRPATSQESDHSPRIFKIMRLESYEDTLNNIEVPDSGMVQRTLEELHGYFLRYMLDFETKKSSCRLNVEKLSQPFDYTIKIIRNNEIKDEIVDLAETFNYLLGLHVRRIKAFENRGTYYKVIHGKKDDNTTTIIWRSTDGLDLIVDKKFIEDCILQEFGATKVYVNTDCFVEGAIPIEPEFKRLMGA